MHLSAKMDSSVKVSGRLAGLITGWHLHPAPPPSPFGLSPRLMTSPTCASGGATPLSASMRKLRLFCLSPNQGPSLLETGGSCSAQDQSLSRLSRVSLPSLSVSLLSLSRLPPVSLLSLSCLSLSLSRLPPVSLPSLSRLSPVSLLSVSCLSATGFAAPAFLTFMPSWRMFPKMVLLAWLRGSKAFHGSQCYGVQWACPAFGTSPPHCLWHSVQQLILHRACL